MNPDIVSLQTFYASDIGLLTQKHIDLSLSSVCSNIRDERFAGLGYTLPWLERFKANADWILALMPARQGAALQHECEKSMATLLVHEDLLPLSNGALDRILMVHSLEHSNAPLAVLSEAWRVLSPSGCLVVVVPNFWGFWKRYPETPFGFGRSFSKNELNKLLQEAGFGSCVWSEALFFFPFSGGKLSSFYYIIEKFFLRFPIFFPGFIIVEAQKQVSVPVTLVSLSFCKNVFPVFKTHQASRIIVVFLSYSSSLLRCFISGSYLIKLFSIFYALTIKSIKKS